MQQQLNEISLILIMEEIEEISSHKALKRKMSKTSLTLQNKIYTLENIDIEDFQLNFVEEIFFKQNFMFFIEYSIFLPNSLIEERPEILNELSGCQLPIIFDDDDTCYNTFEEANLSHIVLDQFQGIVFGLTLLLQEKIIISNEIHIIYDIFIYSDDNINEIILHIAETEYLFSYDNVLKAFCLSKIICLNPATLTFLNEEEIYITISNLETIKKIYLKCLNVQDEILNIWQQHEQQFIIEK
jgi:hypothetical protein